MTGAAKSDRNSEENELQRALAMSVEGDKTEQALPSGIKAHFFVFNVIKDNGYLSLEPVDPEEVRRKRLAYLDKK